MDGGIRDTHVRITKTNSHPPPPPLSSSSSCADRRLRWKKRRRREMSNRHDVSEAISCYRREREIDKCLTRKKIFFALDTASIQ